MAENPSDRLDLLYRISQTINSSLDLDQVMETLMDEVIAAVQAERGFLMLYDTDRLLTFRTARGMDQRTIEDSDFSISRTIVDRVASQGISLLTSNAQTDDRLDQRASVRLYGLRSVLCVPIEMKQNILGVIYVDNRYQNGIFSKKELELLESIASSAAIAIDNARLYQIAVEKGRMERELQMARDVQKSLIPLDTPIINGWEFAACWKPAHEVSGDFYDFIPLSDNRLGVIVADVSDKGMPAALFMALSRSILRSVIGQNGSPANDVIKANAIISRDTADNMFITLFYGELDPERDAITYVNAGHNPPIMYNAKEGRLMRLFPTGMAAGMEGDSQYQQHTVKMAAGDFLLMFTDGVVDAQGDGEPFGEEKLTQAVSRFHALPASGMIQAIEEELCNYTQNSMPVDDVTLLVIKKKNPASAGEEK